MAPREMLPEQLAKAAIERSSPKASTPSRIHHKAEFYHRRSYATFAINKIADLKVSGPQSDVAQEDKPWLEVITSIVGRRKKHDMKDTENDPLRPRNLPFFGQRSSLLDDDHLDDVDSKTITADEVEVHSVGSSRLVIHSPIILDALRRLIDYYPGQDLTGTSVTIKEPYMCLVHYHEELLHLVTPCSTDTTTPCTHHLDQLGCGEDTKLHIQELLNFLQPTIDSKIQPALEKLQRPVPVITFDMAWLLFRPGEDMYSEYNSSFPGSGIITPTVVTAAEHKIPTEESKGEKTPYWLVSSWAMATDGEKIGRYLYGDRILHYEGEKEVTQLTIYPAKYGDKALRSALIKRGRLVFDLLHCRSKAVFFSGTVYTEKQQKKYRGRAIIDLAATARYNVIGEMVPFMPTPRVMSDRSPHLLQAGGKANKYSEYDVLDVDVDPKKLTDRHFLLMVPLLGGFGLGDKEWKIFHVSGIEEASYDDKALDKLVLGQPDLNIIKAVSYRQAAKAQFQSLDFIEGKGEGQVLLLHGPPGVGKTYTVESIAAKFGRPLLSLSIADIGTEEKTMEKNLTRWLEMAEKWNAVLLIDEADVFLEKRSKDQYQRNGLVSVFLRKMEYFQGLLFLTTNRIGQIDDAFASRIHAKINYPRLDDTKRSRIWEQYFERLAEEKNRHPRLFVGKVAREYVLTSPEIIDCQWNGREIRNAFQTAIALAQYEAVEDQYRPRDQAVEVKQDHFRQVMEMSRKFKDYVDSLRGTDEAARAKARSDRNDGAQDSD